MPLLTRGYRRTELPYGSTDPADRVEDWKMNNTRCNSFTGRQRRAMVEHFIRLGQTRRAALQSASEVWAGTRSL